MYGTKDQGTYVIISKGNGARDIMGLEYATTGGGRDMGDHVSYYPTSACSGVTRIAYFHYRHEASDDLAATLASLQAAERRGVKVCAKCTARAAELLAVAS